MIHDVETVLDNMPKFPSLVHRNETPSYNLLTDVVTIPSTGKWGGGEDYYSTLFHELAHSTAHESRLGRLNGEAVIRGTTGSSARRGDG